MRSKAAEVSHLVCSLGTVSMWEACGPNMTVYDTILWRAMGTSQGEGYVRI